MISDEQADLLTEQLSEKYKDILQEFQRYTMKIYEGTDVEQNSLHIQTSYVKEQYVGKKEGQKILEEIFDWCLEEGCHVTLYWDTDGGQALEDLWRYDYGFEYYDHYIDKYGMKYASPRSDGLMLKEVFDKEEK